MAKLTSATATSTLARARARSLHSSACSSEVRGSESI